MGMWDEFTAVWRYNHRLFTFNALSSATSSFVPDYIYSRFQIFETALEAELIGGLRSAVDPSTNPVDYFSSTLQCPSQL